MSFSEPTAMAYRDASAIRLQCRPIRAGAIVVAVTTSDAGIRDRYDQLLAGFPDGSPRDAAVRVAEVWIGLVQPPGETSGALVELWLDGERELPPWTDEAICENQLLTWIDMWALESEPERIHLHAGLVSLEGAGILLVGPKGAGKSTLVTHLVRSGWVYHSDEMVGFEPDRPLCGVGLPCPVSLKAGSWPLFPELETVRARRHLRRVKERIHIPPGELGSMPSSAPCEVRAIVFLVPGEADELRPVSPSEAIERCVADSMDLGRSGVAGMGALVRLVTATRRFRLGTCELTRAAALLGDVVGRAPVRARPLAWELLPEVDTARPARTGHPAEVGSIGSDTKVQRAARTASWSLFGGAVIYDPSRETVTCLNRSAAEMWRQLDGRSANELTAEPDIGRAVATENVLAVLRRLHEEKLVEA